MTKHRFLEIIIILTSFSFVCLLFYDLILLNKPDESICPQVTETQGSGMYKTPLLSIVYNPLSIVTEASKDTIVTLTALVVCGITCILAGDSVEQRGVVNQKLNPDISGTDLCTETANILYNL